MAALVRDLEANLRILVMEVEEFLPVEDGFDDLNDFAQGVLQDATLLRQAMRAGMPMRRSAATSRRKTQKPRKKRKASAWNTFVKAEMPKVLKAHPRFTPQRAMKEVSKRWRSSPKNPNRGRRKR